jgi:uncharacterized protein
MQLPVISDNILFPIMLIALAISFFVSLIPVMPGPIIVWVVAIAAAFFEQFDRITPLAIGIMTLIMLAGMLSDFWLPLLGMKSGGISCFASIGSFIGGIVGTIFIPIPLVGTLIGCVAGALIAEFIQQRRLDPAVGAGKEAARLFVLGYVVRVVTGLAICIVFLISLIVTG